MRDLKRSTVTTWAFVVVAIAALPAAYVMAQRSDASRNDTDRRRDRPSSTQPDAPERRHQQDNQRRPRSDQRLQPFALTFGDAPQGPGKIVRRDVHHVGPVFPQSDVLRRLDQEARELANAFRREHDEEGKERIRRELMEVTERAFAQQMQTREKEIEQMRRQLEIVQEHMEQRHRLREEIINRRVADLLGQPSPLNWEMGPMPNVTANAGDTGLPLGASRRDNPNWRPNGFSFPTTVRRFDRETGREFDVDVKVFRDGQDFGDIARKLTERITQQAKSHARDSARESAEEAREQVMKLRREMEEILDDLNDRFEDDEEFEREEVESQEEEVSSSQDRSEDERDRDDRRDRDNDDDWKDDDRNED